MFRDFLRKRVATREEIFPAVVGDLFIYHRYCSVGVTGVIYMRITDDRGVKSKFKWVAGTFHKRQKLFFERRRPLPPSPPFHAEQVHTSYRYISRRVAAADTVNAARKRRLRSFETHAAALLRDTQDKYELLIE